MKSKILLLLLCILAAAQSAHAMEFYYQGISFTADDTEETSTCSTSRGSFGDGGVNHTNNLTGDIIIPSVAITPAGRNLAVTSIMNHSFRNNRITSVVIPNSVKRIDWEAFTYCSLKKVIFGKGVTFIGAGAFVNQDHSGKIDVYFLSQNPPTIVKNNTYDHCFNTSINVHVPYGRTSAYEGLTTLAPSYTIVDDADIVVVDDIIYEFNPIEDTHATVVGATNKDITKAIIKPTVTSMFGKEFPVTEIGEKAFFYYTNLKEAVIPNGILKIGDSAFSGSGIEKINLGNTVQEIGDGAFRYCNHIASIGFPQSVKTIGKEAFLNTGLEYVMLGKGLQSIGYGAFSGCKNLSVVEIEDIASWCNVNLAEFANPMYNSHSFYIKGKEQTSLTVPSGVTAIKAYTFRECTSLKELYIPESVQEIGYCSFMSSGLVKINGAENATLIGGQAFADCKDLESVVLAEKPTKINDSAFAKCESLKSVTIKGQLTSLGVAAFGSCKSLSSVDAGNGLGDVKKNAFIGCTSLESVNISSIENWCAQTFANAEANPLYFAKKLTVNNEEVVDLNINADVTAINDFAFINCSSLQKAHLDVSIESIGEQAFAGCSVMKELIIGDNVKTIGNDAFNGDANLSSVTLGKGVSNIGSGIFLGCINLQTLIAKMQQAPLQTEACFENVAYSNATLYVMPSGYSTYRITEPWSGFRRISEFEIIIDEESLGIVDGEIVLEIGESFKIDVSTEPGFLKEQLVWESSNPEVASVKDGMVNTFTQGTADIIVSTGDMSRTIHVYVIKNVESVTLNADYKRLSVGSKFNLIATVTPDDATEKSLIWESSNPDVASVIDGCVNAKSVGSAVITATTINGLTASCHIEVYQGTIGITIDYAASGIEDRTLNMIPGEKKEIKIVVYPENASEMLTWTSSNENAVKVKNGVVEAIAVGSSRVMVRAESGVYASIMVYVGTTSIEDIMADGCNDAEVFNMQGVCILRNATKADLQSLLPGTYIVRTATATGKIVIR